VLLKGIVWSHFQYHFIEVCFQAYESGVFLRGLADFVFAAIVLVSCYLLSLIDGTVIVTHSFLAPAVA
jgi:hypothetical protein